jgi:alpha-1,3-rhamnosyl/mannosyltransferase
MDVVRRDRFYRHVGAAARSRLRFLGYAERDDLRRLYAGAQMFLFPSLYEGFGLPPREAMNAGCPALASDRGSLPEVCGDTLYVAAMNRDDIRRKIEQMMSDDGLRASLAVAGRKRAAAFSTEASVAALTSAYARLQTS